MWLTAEAYTELLYLELIRLRGFRALRRYLPKTAPRPAVSDPARTTAAIVTAAQRACTWYLKPVYCLQHSMVVTRLLRRRGVAAELVIGCRIMPLASHAWVEVAGDVVCDRVDGLEFYHVLDRW